MEDYQIYYEDKDGDSCKVWLSAESVDDAKERVRDEYWDIAEIVSVNLL